eukprot:TRINITY_DN8576_c0_g1_i1.p1 TRINITY_DN8576_c0_g1~~TRINITY_DN8576_c0_g1_i1.p1  ORF type:complete len:173 (-),score=61.00 TRINITY_DN8576_c0_g1_i1:152-670(-)
MLEETIEQQKKKLNYFNQPSGNVDVYDLVQLSQMLSITTSAPRTWDGNDKNLPANFRLPFPKVEQARSGWLFHHHAKEEGLQDAVQTSSIPPSSSPQNVNSEIREEQKPSFDPILYSTAPKTKPIDTGSSNFKMNDLEEEEDEEEENTTNPSESNNTNGANDDDDDEGVEWE